MSDANIFQDSCAMTGRLGQLSPEEFVKLIDGICMAVEELDTEYHGNLHPANISMDDAGAVALGDPIRAEHPQYTPDQLEYLAPEAFRHNAHSHRGDVYSIGMLMYTWANCGCLPFLYPDANSVDRAEAVRRRMSGEAFELPPVSDALNAVINKATAYRPERRYETVAQLHEAFRLFAEQVETDSAAMTEAREALMAQKQQEAAMMANILAAAEAAAEKVDPNAPKPVKRKKQPAPQPKKKEEETKNMSLRPLVAVLLIAAILMVAAVAMQFGADNTTLSDNPSESPISSTTPVVITGNPNASPDVSPYLPTDVSPSPDVQTTDNPFLATPTPSPAPIVTIDTSRYSVVKTNSAWTEAAETCMDNGGYLTTINTQDEFTGLCALADKYGLDYVWIGAFRKSGSIVWINGESTDFLAWGAGEPSYRDPNGTSENFVMLAKTNGVWGYRDVVDNPAATYPDQYSGKMGYIMER